MSNISDIIDTLEALVESQVTGITKIPNPYEPEANNDLYLQNGYGIGFGAGSNTDRNINGRVTIQRDFLVMLFRVVSATEQDGDAIKTSSKEVLEDELKIIKAIVNSDVLNGAGNRYAYKTEYSQSDQLEFLAGDSGNRYWQQITAFSVEYAENLT